MLIVITLTIAFVAFMLLLARDVLRLLRQSNLLYEAEQAGECHCTRHHPSEAYLATPRQQYEVALAIWRRYGFSGWGCRGA